MRIHAPTERNPKLARFLEAANASLKLKAIRPTGHYPGAMQHLPEDPQPVSDAYQHALRDQHALTHHG